MKKLLLLFAVGLTSAISAQNIPSYVPTDSLVGWWPFNGNANDESGNGHNGIIDGALLNTDRNGDSISSLFFDGLNDVVVVPDAIDLRLYSDEFTIALWYKIASYGITDNFFISKTDGPGGQNKWMLSHQSAFNGGPFANFHTNGAQGSYNLNTTPNSDSSWHHFVVTKTPTTVDLYFDGAFQVSSSNFPFQTSNADIRIGGDEINGGGHWHHGQLDDIGIWHRALTPAEIQGLYNAQSCTYIDTVLLAVTDTLIIDVNFIGFNPVQFEHSVKAYPNPAKDHLVMDIPSAMVTQGYSIDIKNAAGQSVFQSQLNQAQLQIDLTTWGNGGLYFLHLLDSNGSMVDVKKIILQ